MRDVSNNGPPADGEHPGGRDPHASGGETPVGTNPTGEDAPAGRDNLGELDTFDDTPTPAGSSWETRRNRVKMMDRWRAACERAFRQGMGNDGPPLRRGL